MDWESERMNSQADKLKKRQSAFGSRQTCLLTLSPLLPHSPPFWTFTAVLSPRVPSSSTCMLSLKARARFLRRRISAFTSEQKKKQQLKNVVFSFAVFNCYFCCLVWVRLNDITISSSCCCAKLHRKVKDRILNTVSDHFGSTNLYLTKPTFFSNITAKVGNIEIIS